MYVASAGSGPRRTLGTCDPTPTPFFDDSTRDFEVNSLSPSASMDNNADECTFKCLEFRLYSDHPTLSEKMTYQFLCGSQEVDEDAAVTTAIPTDEPGCEWEE